MSRRAPTLPVTPKMLRHFAIITVSLTGLIALFADGESREAIEDQLAEQKAKSAALLAERQAGGTRSVTAITKKFQNTSPPPPVFGGDGLAGDGSGFGNDNSDWAGSANANQGQTGSNYQPVSDREMSAAGIATNKPHDRIEEQRRKREQEKLKRARKSKPDQPSEDQAQEMLDASRERTGVGEGEALDRG